MKVWASRLLLGLAALVIVVEIVAAPVEWLWPQETLFTHLRVILSMRRRAGSPHRFRYRMNTGTATTSEAKIVNRATAYDT